MSSAASQEQLKNAIVSQILSTRKGTFVMAFFIGGYVDSLLMGLFIFQLFRYRRFVTTDPWHVVLAVALVAMLSLAATIIILLWGLHLFVFSFGNYVEMTRFDWITRYGVTAVALIAVVQTFYVNRARALYRHWWPVALMGPLVAATFAFGTAYLQYMGSVPWNGQESQDDPVLKVRIYSWLGTMVLTDIAITAIISYGLYRIKTGWSHTDTALRRLMIRCFETQTPALLSSTIALIMFNVRLDIVNCAVVLQSKIFALGLLMTLTLRGGQTAPTTVAIPQPTSSATSRSGSAYPMGHVSGDRRAALPKSQTKYGFSVMP